MAVKTQRFYGSVTAADILDLPAGGSALKNRGAWTANTAYAVGDIFTHGGSSYLVSTAFTSGATFGVSDTTNAPVLAAKGDTGPAGSVGPAGPTGASGLTFRGAWSSSTAYVANDLVTWGGSGYVTSVAKAAGSLPPTGTSADPGTDDTAVNPGWTLLVLEGARGLAGTNGTNGAAGTNGINGQGFTNRGAWAANTAYVPYDIVTYQGSTYLATTSFTSGATFNASNWTLWAAKGTDGVAGTAATITPGTTTTTAPGTTAAVTNRGTSSAAIFDFSIPRGDIGPAGAGINPVTWTAGTTYAVGDFVEDSTRAVHRVGVAHTALASFPPSLGPLINYGTSTAFQGSAAMTVVAGGGTITSTLLTSSDVPSGSYARYTVTATPTSTTANVGVLATSAAATNVARSASSFLVRAWVRTSKATTARIGMGNPPTYTSTAAVLSGDIAVPANTWTLLEYVLPRVPLSSAVSVSFPIGSLAANDTFDVSSAMIIEWPATLMSATSAVTSALPFWWNSTLGPGTTLVSNSSRLAWYFPLYTPPAAITPLVFLPSSQSYAFQRDVLAYNSLLTYAPGALVTTSDGSLWEAAVRVPLDEPPLRCNYVANPSFELGLDGWDLSGTGSTNTGVVSYSSANVGGSQVLRADRAAGTNTTAGTGTTVAISTSLGQVVPTTTFGFSMRVMSDNATSFSVSLVSYDRAGNISTNSSTATLPYATPGAWQTITGTVGFGTNTTVRTVATIFASTTTGPGTSYVLFDDICFSDRYGAATVFFSGSNVASLPQPAASSGWRGAAQLSRSLAASSYWRLIAPGSITPGRPPVRQSFFAGDFEYHLNAGERTIGF